MSCLSPPINTRGNGARDIEPDRPINHNQRKIIIKSNEKSRNKSHCDEIKRNVVHI